MSKGPQHVALIGSYPPRRCGIATFTHDLYNALAELQKGRGEVYTLAMNDTKEGYPYAPEVRLEIRENELDDYRMASDFLNIKIVDGVILQHEYGIFGGSSGRHILGTLADLRMPVLTTLHTILLEPNDEQKAVMEEVIKLSERIVVMSKRGVDMLSDIYGAPREKLVLIPHGIPDVPFVDPNYYKDQFGVEGRKVLLTFGLLSPGKGIEHVIQALPEITSKFPEVTYLVLGVTHPHVKKHHGEEYRLGLQRMAEKLGVKDNVFFLNRFVELEELCQCIGAADIYVTPYLKKEQITSGTLSYALGAGKAVVSTPYWHAEELLADDRGKLVPFENPDAIAQA
ncbi:glycosyltransferase family 4 protein, partial [Planctomycetota bacterium]